MAVRAGWSKDKTDWKNLAHVIKKNEVSWTRIKSLSSNSIISVPDSPGLYMLCSSPPENNLNEFFTPLYIGKSKSLKTRLRRHIKNPQSSVKDTYMISKNIELLYTKCNIDNLDEVENCLIRAFGPITNLINAKSNVEVIDNINGNLGSFNKINY